jgi:hypothetical protein
MIDPLSDPATDPAALIDVIQGKRRVTAETTLKTFFKACRDGKTITERQVQTALDAADEYGLSPAEVKSIIHAISRVEGLKKDRQAIQQRYRDLEKEYAGPLAAQQRARNEVYHDADGNRHQRQAAPVETYETREYKHKCELVGLEAKRLDGALANADDLKKWLD